MRVPGLSPSPASLRRATAVAGLGGVVACSLAIAAGTASRPSPLVPASWARGLPDWLGGPLADLGGSLTELRFGALLIVMSACYVIALRFAGSVPARWAVVAIAAAQAAIVVGPLLLSRDAFSYLAYARLAVVHGLDPYTHAPLAVPHDPVLPYVGWRHAASVYGPLFTVGSYALVPLGVAGGMWALKLLAGAAAGVLVALTWAAARRLGRPPVAAALFVGLNPLLLVYGIGGAHNDLIVASLLAAGVVFALGGRDGAGAGVVVGAAAVKATAGLVLPFMLVGARRPRAALAGTGVAVVVVAGLSFAAFGGDAAGFARVLFGDRSRVATFSFPSEVARAVGLAGVPGWLRAGAFAAFAGLSTWLLAGRARRGDWIGAAGWAMVALLLATTWLLPWYVVWLLPLAALAPDRRLRVAALLLAGAVLGGHLATFLPHSAGQM